MTQLPAPSYQLPPAPTSSSSNPSPGRRGSKNAALNSSLVESRVIIHPATLDPGIAHQSEEHSTPIGTGVRRRDDSISSGVLCHLVWPVALGPAQRSGAHL
ncbi:hypothetical protein CORC01_09389 [Colletotrichum orchidophilum]|uniref:Uncharacterized protein n=1 Tax=Colletotrichum orchidophilum TaxID=1209926 RepID=A0A1G4B1H3_9PEZI|nr:uncharacterized protein CORC01_09389 [Colletotrichum orchidophilum]OHE95244.1 hypothetical protein CORC01_09389 [Colletotrichum orchidophilum]